MTRVYYEMGEEVSAARLDAWRETYRGLSWCPAEIVTDHVEAVGCDGRWACTREEGHSGSHVGHRHFGHEVCCVWGDVCPQGEE